MPERWMQDAMGDEARPRPGFEDELARTLHREWRGGGRWRMAAWAVAAAAVLVGVIVVATREPDRTVTPTDTTTDTVAESVVPVPSSVVTTVATTAETAPPETPETLPDTTVEGDPGFEAVQTYLQALALDDWDTAAGLLFEGGLELEARADVRPLFRAEYGLVPGLVTRDALASALQLWCQDALCIQPFTLAGRLNGKVKATYRFGDVERSSMFTGFVFEGSPGVYGLPLQFPAGSDIATTVECPDDQVVDMGWVDLDGDGWLEQAVVTWQGNPGFPYVVHICGSPLQVEPHEQLSDYVPLVVSGVDRTGASSLLYIASAMEDRVSGALYGLPRSQLAGSDGTTLVAMTDTLSLSPPEQLSFGCDGGSIVEDSYEYVGGTDLSSSTAFTFTRSVVIGPELPPSTRTLGLPDSIDEAFRVVVGYCNGLPVMAE